MTERFRPFGPNEMHHAPPPVCLVCEDEPLIALDLESCLADAGIAVAGPFKASDEALCWMREGHAPDLALLNFKLLDGSCVPLVRTLLARGVPIVMQSGVQPDAADTPPEVLGLPWLSKPFRYGDLLNAVWRAVPSLALDRRRRWRFNDPREALDGLRGRPEGVERRSTRHQSGVVR